MKKLVLLFVALASQVVNADVIKLYYGEPIKGKVTEIIDEYIKYIPDDENLVRTIGSIPVSRIEFDNEKLKKYRL